MKLPAAGILGLIYVTSEVLLTVRKRARTSGPSRDAHSWRLLWIVITASIFAGMIVARKVPAAALPEKQQIAAAGVALFAIGLVLRACAIALLGRFFTVNVAIAADHQLIEAGPYRYIRHPSYTGALLAFLGLSLTIGNWLSILVLMLPIIAVFIYRMNVEERALIAGLGEKYIAYIRRTKRLLPFVY